MNEGGSDFVQTVGRNVSGLGKHLYDTFFRYPYVVPDHAKDARYEVNQRKPKNPDAMPVLSHDNAVIYMGKLFRHKVLLELFLGGLLAVNGRDKIYGDEFISAALHYAARCLKPGEKIRIVLGRIQSELLNGKEDVEETYSEIDQRGAILSLSRRVGLDSEQVEIVSLEDVPENKTLFARLRECVDLENGGVDIEKAYGSAEVPELSADPSALEIAQLLYFAIKQPQNEKLRQKFFNMRPAKIKLDQEKEEKQAAIQATKGIKIKRKYPESCKYYGLTEVAVRLRAILSGQYIHGGADRQGIYDAVIDAILKAGRPRKKGNQQNEISSVKELQPLFALFNNTDFETFNVDTERNFYKETLEKRLARPRRLIYLNLIGLAVLAIRTCYIQHELDKREEQIFNEPTIEMIDHDFQNWIIER